MNAQAQIETMTLDQMGDWMIGIVAEQCLARLAVTALRKIRDEVRHILDDAVGRLAGASRTADEAARIAAMLALATPPADLAAAPVAPARGPMRLIDNVIRRPGGILHRDGSRHGQRLDRLTMMCREAWLSHQRKGGDAASFRPPFTPGQIAMADRYQALVERHAAAGMKCASAEVRAVAVSGDGSGDFMVAYLTESRELDRIVNRIGSGVALAVTRRSPGRRDITARALVDAVCRDGDDLTAVLRAHGWAKKTDSLMALRRALAAALDRMQGYPEKGA